MSFAPAGKFMTVEARRHAIRIWDAKTGKHLHAIPTTRWTSAGVSPDGTRIATAAHDNTVRLLDANTGREIFRLPGHGELGPRYRVAFSADGKQFATFGNNHHLRVWNTTNGRALHENRIRPGSLEFPDDDDNSPEATSKRRMLEFKSLQSYFSPDARLLIVSVEGKLHVYDAETGKERVKFDAEDGYNVAISPDSRWLLMAPGVVGYG